jgi:hypothetical protein
MAPQSTPAKVFDPARLARLSRGLLMTLRSLSSNRGGDEWTNGVTVGKRLGIQQFYKEFHAWIREMEALSASKSEPLPAEERNNISN